MTISSSTDRATFPGNGVTQIFDLPFRFFDNGDIQAWLIDDATGALTPLTLGTHYTLSGAGDPEVDGSATGQLTMLTAPAVGQSLFVQRVLSLVQPTDIVNQGRFFPEIHEGVFDRLTMLIQQQTGESGKALRVIPSEPNPAFLPLIKDRANRLLSFDSEGNPIAVAPASGDASELAIDLANSTDPAKGAELIGFLSGGAGAIGRTVYSKLQDTVSVKDFGAVGDGGANDYAAIKAAVESGRSVYFPDGVYLVDLAVLGAVDDVGISLQSNTTLSGSGTLKCVHTLPAVTGTLPDLFVGLDVENVTIRGLSFDNVSDQNTTSTNKGAKAFVSVRSSVDGACNNIVIEGCSFNKSFATCVEAPLYNAENTPEVRGVRVTNCTFTNTGGHGVAIAAGVNCVVANNTFKNVGNLFFDTVPISGVAIDFSNMTHDSVAIGNVITDCRFGMKTQDYTVGDPGNGGNYGNIFMSNTIRGMKADSTYAIQVSGLYNTVKDNEIFVDAVPTAACYGIIVGQSAFQSLISGNTIVSSKSSAIRIEGSALTANINRGTKVLDNYLEATAASIPTILLVNDTGAEFSGNTIKSTSGAGISATTTAIHATSNEFVTGGRAIDVPSTGDNSGGVSVHICDNRVTGGGRIVVTPNYGKVTITGNTIQNNIDGSAIQLIGVGSGEAVTITGNSVTCNNNANSSNCLSVTNVTNAVVSGNSFKNNRTGSNAHTISGSFTRSVIAGNLLAAANGYAISFTGGGYVAVSGNTFNSAGLGVQGLAANSVATGNVVAP